MTPQQKVSLLRKRARRLVDMVQAFGEARFMDDEKDMEKYGRKVDDAMTHMRAVLNITGRQPKINL